MMNPLLQQLHDIDEIDPIHWWPLPLGWMVVAFFSLILLGLCLYALSKWIAFRRSWKSDFLMQLREIEKKLRENKNSELITLLSQLLRRMVLQLFSRKECASLTGSDWLQWLTERDPKKFNWNDKGKILIRAPYAPIDENEPDLSPHEIKEMIQAMKRWIR
jgi:Domain of unknown function (DUF4381)